MKMPSRKDYVDPNEFLSALNGWMGASESAYQFARGLYEATPEFEAKPEWIDQAEHVSNVTMMAEAFDASALEPCLRNLTGSVMNRGMKIVRVAHGKVREDNSELWVCFAECEPQ